MTHIQLVCGALSALSKRPKRRCDRLRQFLLVSFCHQAMSRSGNGNQPGVRWYQVDGCFQFLDGAERILGAAEEQRWGCEIREV